MVKVSNETALRILDIIGQNPTNKEKVERALGIKIEIPQEPQEDLEEALEMAIYTEECQQIYARTSDPIIKEKALEKILCITDNVNVCWTIYSCAEATVNTKAKALKKIQTLFKLQMDSAKTVEKCLEIYENAKKFPIVKIQTGALKKASSLAKTYGDFREVYSVAPSAGKIHKMAQKKIEYFLNQQLEKATTVQRCRDVYDDSPYGSAIEKKAIKKIEILSIPKLNSAKTATRCINIYDQIPEESKVTKRAIRKALSLASSLDEYANMWSSILGESPEERLCIIQKMAELLEKEK